jgi:hypothetical protein
MLETYGEDVSQKDPSQIAFTTANTPDFARYFYWPRFQA